MNSRAILAVLPGLLMWSASVAWGGECSNHPDAIGTSRTASVNPTDFPFVGKLQYKETLRLKSREVVITFGDGPVFPYTGKILDALAAECAKATFFVLRGKVEAESELLRRMAKESHSIGTSAFEDAAPDNLSPEGAEAEVALTIKAAADALGPGEDLAPFFRASSLKLTPRLEKHLVSRNLMVWSADVDSQDWNDASEEQLIQETMEQLRKAGRGIVLLHDSEPVTARALPRLLKELKRQEFQIVHVVAADSEPVSTGTVGSVQANKTSSGRSSKLRAR